MTIDDAVGIDWAPEAMHMALAVALTALVCLWIFHRLHRGKCKWCGNRHPLRPLLMTAEEFLRIYCGGWRALNRQQTEEKKR